MCLPTYNYLWFAAKSLLVGLGVGRRSSEDYFYLFFPHPTPHTPPL
ncbi:MAG: hypothetical protein PX481_12755 [Microcystis sp. M53603_WE2]|nr:MULTISPECIES: hypothetical protein [unclassified Microcystis]MCZ8119368.1 hypothetical protein [Microcystis sp. LE18-22.4A]MCZ8363099.1 hypothetical protein [Microcystis sp. LE19-251.1A]MDJ0526602.1 hypothetical protein [Microcystis sp. M53600_WE12]MDJ0547516.1 hypothetical protein [Microcystis sp. M53601_WE4]NCR79090.1 hypothetical protein [Microcystis aeruginosa K13-10]